MTRRQAMAGVAISAGLELGLELGLGTARAAGSSLPATPSVFVAGPAGGVVDQWATLIAGPMGIALQGPSAPPLASETVGGADGVTGVNQFQARTAPDGATALLMPGAALMAWLVGDTRVRFDVGTWAPLWGATTGAFVATRAPLVAGRALRVAVPGVGGPGLEALLALELMGIDAIPMIGRSHGEVDAVYLRGGIARDPLAAAGFVPAFSLTGRPGRDPAFPDLPQAAELFTPARATDREAIAVFQAVSAAASIEVALVMPAVVPAAVLAWWRHGCAQMDDAAAVRAAALSASVRQDDAGQIATQLSCVALDMTAMLSLRTRLAERYHWRPS